MSMPSFPPNGADMTRDEALTMIIASIAMEELALSHILNAEGEKLQYILGTLPGPGPCACPQDVLAVNKSVTALLEAVTQNQMLLKNKLAQALEFCPPPPPECGPEPGPCPPPCREPSRQRGALQLAGQQEGMLWSPDCRLPWSPRSCCGTGVRWDRRTPTQLRLDPGRSFAVQYTLNVCAPPSAEGELLLKQSPRGAFTEPLPLRFSAEGPRQTLHAVSVLHPRAGCDHGAALSLALKATAPLCVERAVMDVVEL